VTLDPWLINWLTMVGFMLTMVGCILTMGDVMLTMGDFNVNPWVMLC